MANKKVIVSVISDLYSDQRVHKVCNYLLSKNVDVLCVGRSYRYSKALTERRYQVKRLQCYFKSGPLQYLEFNARLFFFLLANPADIYVANDLDTLGPNYLLSIIRRKPVVYDSHEYFTGMAELESRPIKRKIWKLLERLILPRIRFAYTVNHSIQQLYKDEYRIHMEVVRNVPVLSPSILNAGITGNYQMIVQGAGMNNGRGMEEIIQAMAILPSQFRLLLVGSGIVWENCRKLSQKLNLTDRIEFKDRVPFEQLAEITKQSWLGLSLDRPVSVNNRYFLPNKIFDYIHAGIPILASSLPEVKAIIEQYSVGLCIEQVTPQSIATAIQFIYDHPEKYREWQQNTARAARELNWDLESEQLDKVYNRLI
jgi:glycosyltransferase involved in cell wall biosynthesis